MSETAQGHASGVLEVLQKGGGFLRDPGRSFTPDKSDIFVPQAMIKKLNLSTGAMVAGSIGRGKKGPVLATVESVCGVSPAEFASRTPLKELTALNPDQRFHLGKSGNPSMRIIDLIAPIAKGTRGLIVSPPKAGKTTLLENIATAIHEDAPETRIRYPVTSYPQKVRSFNLDKTPDIGGTLTGIKGQYLIFNTGVINVRKYGGYHLTLTLES